MNSTEKIMIINIKLPRTLNNKLRSQAAIEDMTKNELILKAVNVYLDKIKPENQKNN